MPSRFVLVAAGLLLAVSVATAGAEAAPPTPHPPAATAEKVRLAAFMAPVRRADGRIRSVAVTPVLALTGAGSAATVCDLSPRVLDAFIAALYRVPLSGHGKGGLDIDGARGRLTEAVNSALGGILVSAVDLIPGIPEPAPGDGRLAGTLSCRTGPK